MDRDQISPAGAIDATTTMDNGETFPFLCNVLYIVYLVTNSFTCLMSPIHIHTNTNKKIVSENQPKLVSFRPTMTLAILHLLLLFNFAFSDWVGDLEMKVGIF